MLRALFVCLLLAVVTNLSADDSAQPGLDFSHAWFKPELMENNDPACGDLLKDAQEKYFTETSFGAAYGIAGHGYSKTGTVLDWTIVTQEEGGHVSQLKAYGKTFYLDYLNHPGCGGACERNQPLVSDKPFPEGRDYDYLEKLAADAPPAASYNYTIAETPTKMFYLFIVGSAAEYKNQLLIYKLAPEARWKPACTISLAPKEKELEKSSDNDLSLAITSINDLKRTIAPLHGDAGSCGSMHTNWRWTEERSTSFKQALHRPWALPETRSYPSANSYGEYLSISRQLEQWSLTGLFEYNAHTAYKTQLEKTIRDISVFYQKKFGWSEHQSIAMAEVALPSALSRGFGFYMYNPQFAPGEMELRRAILEKKSINEIKAIQFDVEKIDVQINDPWVSGSAQSQESILNISVDYPAALQYLLEKGVNPDTANAFGKTPLMYAAQYNQVDSAKVLIEHKANTVATTTRPNDTCYYVLRTSNMTPLHYAVRYGSPEFIQLLLENGAATFIKAENHRKHPMKKETPLDWFHKYTAIDSPEKNPNIPNERIAEVEKWLQPPSTEELAAKARTYVLAAEQAYQKGDTKLAYRDLTKAVAIQPDNERALSDLSLVALKNSDLGISLEASERLIKTSSDGKTKANAWFNQGLACAKFRETNEYDYGLVYNGNSYCQQSILYPYLQSWINEKSTARANKLLELFINDGIESCEITLTDDQTYKLHFSRIKNMQKIYVFHLKEHALDTAQIHWDIRLWNPKTKSNAEPTRFTPTSVASYDLGDYVIDELESSQAFRFPVNVFDLACQTPKFIR